MGTLIDSSVIIAAERGTLDIASALGPAGPAGQAREFAIAAITAAELLHGVHRLRGASRARAEAFVERVFADLPVLPFTLGVARVHAALSADLRERGVTVGAHDMEIAATAVWRGWDVATRDLRSFPRIQGLAVQRW
jgi:tRNA(fMet)-specific endonuclease VapC